MEINSNKHTQQLQQAPKEKASLNQSSTSEKESSTLNSVPPQETANVKNLTVAQLNKLDTTKLNKLNATQLNKLNQTQLNKLNTAQLKKLSASNIEKLSDAQKAKLAPESNPKDQVSISAEGKKMLEQSQSEELSTNSTVPDKKLAVE